MLTVIPSPSSEDCNDDDPTIVNSNIDDADCDTIPSSEDCNDNNASISPNVTEVCDGIDNDCDGSVDQNPSANNNPPYSDPPSITSLGGDLIANVNSTSDLDLDAVRLNYDWRLQDQSIAVLNMSFDTEKPMWCNRLLYLSKSWNYRWFSSIYSWNQRKCYVFRWFPRWLYRWVENANFFSSDFSVSTWIKTNVSNKVQSIISQSPASTTNMNEHFLFVGTDDKLKFQSYNSSSNQWTTKTHSTILSTDWTHLDYDTRRKYGYALCQWSCGNIRKFLSYRSKWQCIHWV